MSDSPGLRGGGLVVAAVLALAALAAVAAAAVVLATALWFAHRHPYLTAAMAATLLAAGTAGVPAVAALWLLTVACVLHLRAHRRTAFDRYVLRHWRRTFVYGWRWRRVMAAHDLAVPRRLGRSRAPRLGSVWSSRWADVLSVHPLDGQGADAFAARADDLGRSFGALACRASDDPTGVVRLEVRRGDLLRAPVPAQPVSTRPDPTALPVGRRDDGSPWTVSLEDGHILVVGPPGTGRSVVWSLLRALAAPVHDGTVEVWAVDGSGGVGLAAGSAMFSGLALDPYEATALLGRVTGAPNGRRRCATHAVRPPLTLLVLHDLGRWAPTIETPVHDRLVAALDLALDYGAALGLVVVATTQELPGEVATRFPQRITLGATSAAHSDPPEIGTAVIGGATTRVRVHRIVDSEMSAIAAAFPARSRVEDAPSDGALSRRAVG